MKALLDLFQWFFSWPLIIYVAVVGVIYTVALHGIQFRRFVESWRVTLFPPTSAAAKAGSNKTTPIQAFINTLSTGVGNGSIAGMATAIYAGGPGAAFWVLVFGMLLMAVRFAEVYISVLYGARTGKHTLLGGPMLYLKAVPGGKVLAYVYGMACLGLGLSLASCMQANSIAQSIQNAWGVSTYATAVVLMLFILYVLFGGGERVSMVTSKLVPLNLAIFFLSTFSVLAYHAAALPGALKLIIESAFTPVSAIGGVLGFSVVQAVRLGMSRSTMATEAGLGTAAILFGFTGSSSAVKDGLMSMVSTFISSLICFIVALCIVVSDVWHTGLNGTPLTSAAFNTVFCSFGGYLVSFLSLSFGISVMVGYVYISRATWLFLTGGRWPLGITILYTASVGIGSILTIGLVWGVAEVVIAVMLLINLFGLLWLLPEIRRNLARDLR
jgi:alanine or glycine:cation symporter, AGCS family